MKSMSYVMLALLAIAVVVPFPLSVKASTPVWASVVVDWNQAPMKNGDPVSARGFDNIYPINALGSADSKKGHFETIFSLGYGGYIVLAFSSRVCGSITVHETTWGQYPTEAAKVYGSQDGTTWTYLGTADNSAGMGTDDPHPTIFTLSSWIMYVKIVDVTNPDLHGDISDGFDVDAVRAEFRRVIIDIKPGSWPNSFSVSKTGLIPVAIFGTTSVDVTCTKPESVRLEGTGVAQRGRSGKLAVSYEHVDGDGIVDTVAFFNAQEVIRNDPINGIPGIYELTLTGTLCDGTGITGTDYVRVVGGGRLTTSSNPIANTPIPTGNAHYSPTTPIPI